MLWRVRAIAHSFWKHYTSSIRPSIQLQASLARFGRRAYRPKQHLLFALSYAAVTVTASEQDKESPSSYATIQCYDPAPDQNEEQNWEKVLRDEEVSVYRRWIKSLGVYEYRCAGTYTDITGENFVKAQMEINYRKEWDANVLDLKVLETQSEDTEILRWVHKFPRPMSARLYIYKRQMLFDEQTQSMQVDSEALAECDWPNDSKDKSYVRVSTYKSRLCVRAHSRFDEKGLDYVLTYYDNPRASIPGPAFNWILNYGGPYFLKEVHDAAKKLSTDTKLPE